MEKAGFGIVNEPTGRSKAASLTAEVLGQLYSKRVYKFAQLISSSSSDAEDLAQDALERAIKGLKSFDPARGDLEGWLWRIVVNAGRDAGRIARRERVVFERLASLWRIETRVAFGGDRVRGAELVEPGPPL